MAEKDPKLTKTPPARSTPTARTAAAKPAEPAQPTTAKTAATRPTPTARTAAAKPAEPTQPTTRATATRPTPTARTAAAKPAEPAQPTTARTAATRTTPTARTAAAKPAEPAQPTTARTSATRPTPSARKTPNSDEPIVTAVATKDVETPKRARSSVAADTKTSGKRTDNYKKKGSTRKQTSGRTTRSGRGGAAAATADGNKRTRIIIAAAVVTVILLGIILGIVFGVKSCSNDPGVTGDPRILPNVTVVGDKPLNNAGNSDTPMVLPSDAVSGETFRYEYSATTEVGYSGTVIGNVARYKPVEGTDDGHLPSGYPTYGRTLTGVIGADADKVAARNALIAESSYLTAAGTANAGGGGYTWMDERGYLWKGTRSNREQALDSQGNHRRLYKHTASVGLYLGDVADNEPGIVKRITMRPRGYSSYGVTGIYAPAGEVIKIEISEADMEATGGLTIHIGQALYNGQANNIWAAKGQMQRIPHLLNTMRVTKDTAVLENGVYTAYVGSFIGGPLYIRNASATFTATISGGVAYSHFILGYTTKAEFEQNKNSSAPYFDLEVWNFGVLHSGPKRYAENFSYDDLYKAAVLWEKVSSVTTTGSSQGIVFLYDPFVAAGAAVAFPGRRSVNCPLGWMTSSLNYDAIVSSGSWGNFHEYHHNFQGYGVGNGGEVTNNGMTLVSYALFTKISSHRGIAGNGGAGLGGWNSYTSATWALSEVLKIARGETPSNGNQGLTLYATLLHNFGANNYIQAKYTQQASRYGQSYAGYLKAWQDVTHNDMTYFFKDILQGIDDATAAELRNPEYPTFVPVSSVYQTGRSYMLDGKKKYFATMQPYIIPFGEAFDIDLTKYTAPDGQYASGSIVIPDGFDYKVKSVTAPSNGSLQFIDDYHIKYIPGSALLSGQMIVTLEITKADGAFAVADVDLVLQFEQSHETNKFTLNRTTYSFEESSMYSDAQTAFENGYAGFSGKAETEHSNPTQNCNTDIWYYADTPENREKFPDAPDWYFVPENAVVELSGKLYFEEAGKYRIYLRGRLNCAMYYSTDGGQNFVLGATIKDASVPVNSHMFRPGDPNTYVDLELKEHSWVYFKSVMIAQSSPTVSYFGLGTAKWTEPMFTIVNKYYDANGNEVASETAPNYHHTVTHYYDYRGNEVSEAEANRAELIPPSSTAQPSYVNAYRNTYEFPSNSEFCTDYFYTRKYSFNYDENEQINKNQTLVSTNYSPATQFGNFPIDYLTDGNRNTWIHTRGNVSASAPLEIVMDMGEAKTANRLILYSQNRGDPQIAKAFVLYGSIDGETYFPVHEETDAPAVGCTVTVDFENATFRYYKLVITKSSRGYILISEIELWKVFEVKGGYKFSPDNESFAFKGNWTSEQTLSSFGHVYVGEANAELSFKFNGTRLAFTASDSFGKNFEVYIDGQRVQSIELKPFAGGYGMAFMSDALQNGTHSVTIKCAGEANIDSIIIFDT